MKLKRENYEIMLPGWLLKQVFSSNNAIASIKRSFDIIMPKNVLSIQTLDGFKNFVSVIRRWALIGWLLSTCTSRVATQYNNLALFWDYLAFNPERNSIMDIEPAILVMQVNKNLP